MDTVEDGMRVLEAELEARGEGEKKITASAHYLAKILRVVCVMLGFDLEAYYLRARERSKFEQMSK